MSSRSGAGGSRTGSTAARAAREAQARSAERRAAQQAQRTLVAAERLAAARAKHPNAYRGAQRLASTLPRGVQRELERAGRAIADLHNERLVIADARTGAALLTKNGKVGSHAVSTTSKEDQLLHALRGAFVDLHNHPFGEGNYPTFSDKDYQAAYQRFSPSEARVVTERGVASLRTRTPGATWPSYGKVVRPALDNHFNAIRNALLGAARRSSRSQRGLYELSAGDIMHLAWRRAARETGLIYQRVGLPRGTRGGRTRTRK